MTHPIAICKNCEAPLAGNFCQNCGQKADTHRITIPHLLHEFFHVLTHADKGILLLAKEMIYRPGYVAKEYIEGKRKKYFNPLSYLVITYAFYAIMILKSGYFEALENRGGGAHSYGSEKISIYMAESMELIVNHGKVIGLILMLPLLTTLSFVFFRKRGYNFAETLVLQAFIGGQANLAFGALFIPAFLLFGHPNLNNNIYQAAFFIYLVISYRQFFKDSILMTFIKSVFIQGLFIVLFWILILAYVFAIHLLGIK